MNNNNSSNNIIQKRKCCIEIEAQCINHFPNFQKRLFKEKEQILISDFIIALKIPDQADASQRDRERARQRERCTTRVMLLNAEYVLCFVRLFLASQAHNEYELERHRSHLQHHHFSAFFSLHIDLFEREKHTPLDQLCGRCVFEYFCLKT